VIILAYSGLTFFRLGTTEIPQTCVRINPEDVFTLDVDVSTVHSVLIWSKYGNDLSELMFSVGDYSLCQIDMWVTMWMRFDFEKTDVRSSVLQVKYTGDRYLDIYELVLLDEDGNIVPYSVIDELSFMHDEAELVDCTHSVLTSLYFDELLYSDTVDHYFVDGKILEGTHPPMGKNFIALGVLLFGHNTFGYRFFGALFSVLTLIVMFFLSRRILKKNMCALLATLLLFGDAMYYMQSRVCAIDIYVLCFILLSYLFMIVYAQADHRTQEIRSLCLSGICFGMACASKWIGCYAGVGLAIVFFIVFFYKMKHDSAYCSFCVRLHTLLWCCLFFVVIPVLIYVISYVPVLWIRSNSIGDFFDKIWINQSYMWNWHAHYSARQFDWQSNWYGWPFNIGSFFYFNSSIFSKAVGIQQYIVMCGNPFVWIGGLISIVVCIGYLVYRFVKARTIHYEILVVVIAYLCQYVPWWFIDRQLFIYHYLCAGTISIIGLSFVLYLLWKLGSYWRLIAGFYVVLVLGWFFLMFPFFNGLPVSQAYTPLVHLLVQ
jgi:dolichyl-phosphate-mannose--protein O-mannosyl transferase